jgi:hypothetical protein
MIRNLKLLGLAIAAVLTMSAIAASAASADDFTSEKNPVTVTGKGNGANVFVITITAGVVKCKESSYAAVMTPMTTSMTLTPSIPVKTTGGEQNCTGFGFPAEVNTNGCTFTYTIGAATTGGMDVNCPAGKEITVTAKSGETIKCTAHFPSQSWSSGVSYGNTGAGATREVDVSLSVTGLVVYKHTAGSGIGSCTSGSGSGSYTDANVFTGESGSNHVGIFFS